MQAGIKKWIFAVFVAILAIACVNIGFEHITRALESTNRNELYAPEEYNVSVSNSDGYSKIYENNNFEYYYSNNKTILRIVNKKSGFIWSTGADTERYTTMTTKTCSSVTKYSPEYYACAIDIGPTRNGRDTNRSFAEINGLLYFSLISSNGSEPIWVMSDNTTFGLYGHQTYANQWMFKLRYYVENRSSNPGNSSSASESTSVSIIESEENSSENNSETSEDSSLENSDQTSNSSENEVTVPSSSTIEVNINMRFTFTEDGFDVNIYDEDITGQSKYLVDAIYPLPLLGQSGGKMIRCTIDTVDEDGKGSCKFDASTMIDNPRTNLDGYIFVPDGSGALIRYDNVKYYEQTNEGVYFDMYKDPYRTYYLDKEFQDSNVVQQPDYIETKHISMPVWGVAYGNNQDAFVSYVTQGSEYFGLVYSGRKTTQEYSSIRPRFEKNRTYVYRYGSDSSRSFSLKENELFYYDYDIGLSYNFLQGDGSEDDYPANYVGMALKYRSYLQDNHLIKENVALKTGPKIDFLIGDVKEGIFGYTDVNVTTCEDIVNILTELHNDGIEDITSTLYGWQNGGISKAKPWQTKWNKAVGGKKGFKNIVNTASDYGYEIQFYQQYGMINKTQTSSFNAYVVKALSRDYGTYLLADKDKPITYWYYTNPDVAGEWLNKQAKTLAKLGDNVGIATGGISTMLVPDYNKKLSYAMAANSIYQSTKEAASKLSLSGDTPNAYLWKNYNSFTNISVYNSQLQCETDSVPFMEIVFGGLINLYADYSNFSFYDKISQLKMIDYNLNPSFIVSASENSNIMYTNARDWFSTNYSNYHEIINEICSTTMPFLNKIQGKTMIKREVVEFEDSSLGLYINTYATFDKDGVGSDKTVLAINYFEHAVSYQYNNKTYTIPALSAMELN